MAGSFLLIDQPKLNMNRKGWLKIHPKYYIRFKFFQGELES